MKKLIILFFVISFLSCKKETKKPDELVIAQTAPTPTVTKQERTFKVFGRWDFLKTTLKGKEVIQPFKAFVGDTVNVEAEVNQYHNDWSTLDLYIYFDNTLYSNVKDVKLFKSKIIIQ